MGHQTKFKTYIKINKHFHEIKTTEKKKHFKYNIHRDAHRKRDTEKKYKGTKTQRTHQ